ncbi:hypothetical protein F5Y17DRAFT_474277 [Xylariaceae sp. FL0594]|nr:hypothetical protein F5Y17DRAFT_474277 [Xylariaceae sp. FL0594]
MSVSVNSTVYLGLWTNWSRGMVFGATLTTTKTYGNLLISFTVVFIGVATSRLWKILCLLMHRYHSTGDPRGPLHHQRQVVLRNSASPEAGLFDVIRLCGAWRKSGMRKLLGLLFLILFALLYLVAITAAGGFSATITIAVGDEALIKSRYCGPILSNGTYAGASIIAQFALEKVNNAANYAQQCYSTGDTTDQAPSTAACSKFVASTLHTTTAKYDHDCPFHQNICRKPNNTLRLDSGYMDSHNDLGLNAPGNERIAIRHVLQCTPLETKGYTSSVVEVDQKWIRYNYGTKNDIFNGSGDFDAIPELARSDGDLVLVFLSGNGVLFAQEMDDDWYRATERWKKAQYVYAGPRGSLQTYHPDIAASPLGCLEQWQYCNTAYPKKIGCGPLASWVDALYGVAPLFNLTDKDLDPERPSSSSASGARLIWPFLWMYQYPTTLATIVSVLGVKSLASQTRFQGGQLDVLNWWDIMSASMQASWLVYLFVDTARGTTDPEYLGLWSPPMNKEEEKWCNSQKIRSSEYTSFSFFALAVTFITGALIVLVSYTIEPVLGCLHKRRSYKPYAHLEWVNNSSLQLHRLAHEELGVVWSNCDKEIPLTSAPDEMLANLDITDPKHPTLRPPKKRSTHNPLMDTQSGDSSDHVTIFGNASSELSSSSTVVGHRRVPMVSNDTPLVLRIETEFEDSASFTTTVLQSIAETTDAVSHRSH